MAAEAEDAFWRDQYDAYLREYPDQFVAVDKASGQFVTAASNLERLIGLIQDNRLDVQRVWVRYMAATPTRLAL